MYLWLKGRRNIDTNHSGKINPLNGLPCPPHSKHRMLLCDMLDEHRGLFNHKKVLRYMYTHTHTHTYCFMSVIIREAMTAAHLTHFYLYLT